MKCNILIFERDLLITTLLNMKTKAYMTLTCKMFTLPVLNNSINKFKKGSNT